MDDLLVYLGQVSLISIVFYLIYWLLIRYDTTFHWRRSYLLASLILPFVLPLISLEIPIDISEDYQFIEPILLSETVQDQNIQGSLSPIERDIDVLNLLPLCIWILGVVIMTIRLAFILMKIIRMCLKLSFSKYGRFYVAHSQDIQTPCSFFQLILLPHSTASHEEIVITHESIHGRQLHTIDVLASELLLIFQWFNPIFWLIRRVLREVHEYLADEGVLKAGFSPKRYQILLLTYSAGEQQFALANAINQLTIIKRINMMNTKKSSRFSRFRYLAIMPAIFVCLFMTNCRSSLDVDPDSRLLVKGQVFRAATEEPLIGAAVIAKGTHMGALTDVNGEFWLALPRAFFEQEKQPALAISYVDVASQTININQDGELKVWLSNNPEESSHQFEEKDMSAELAEFEGPYPSEEAPPIEEGELAPAFKFGAEKQPLFIVDGEAVKDQEGMNNIDPNQIKEIKIIKDSNNEEFESYLEQYGDKVKNGVILITTK